MLYEVFKFIFRLLFKIFFRIQYIGTDNFPKDGAVILASNHASFFDPIIAGISCNRPLYFMARKSLFRNNIFGKILIWVNALPLKRDSADFGAFRDVLAKLREGKSVLIYPEGTRSIDGNLGKPKAGIGFLAVSSKAKVVPCYIKGSREALPKGARFPKFTKISVYYGEPLEFGRTIGANDTKKGYYNYIAQEVMYRIAELKKKADEG